MSQATAEQTAGTPTAEAPAHFSTSHRELTDALNLAAPAIPPRPPSRPWAPSSSTPKAAP
ncbi:hypothetical protein [Actinacidiphila soli]|uniref:hypothetical protein n=1 Tax=Actinacidiphila soli TaxID=2487275 RepID=UPI0013E33984|nr:hypothetical protein [Actinacidiphila soli]